MHARNARVRGGVYSVEKQTSRNLRFGVSVTPEEKELLQSAGLKIGRRKLADFVRQAALDKARDIHEQQPDSQG